MPSIRTPILRYLIRKILAYTVTLFVSFTVVFLVLRLIPGDPISQFVFTLQQRYSYKIPATIELVEEYRRKLGLEGDLFTQYVRWLRQVFWELDFGPSLLNFPNPSQSLILRALPWSIGLLSAVTLLSWALGMVLGTLAGWKRDTKIGSVLFTFAISLSQIPYYLLAILLVLTLAYTLSIFPARGAFSPAVTPGITLDFVKSILYHAFLPSLSIVLPASFGWSISTRAMVVTILGEDYLLYAQAKGLRRLRILNRYILRNILLPQTTQLAMSLGFVVNGFYLVEWIFQYPGIGTLLANAITSLDYNTVQGIILVSIFAVLTANLVMDVIYPLLDPRVRHGG